MALTTPTTKLEAVNTLLSHQGEEPYNSISGDVTAEVRAAVAVLDEITKEVLSRGWLFNTETDYPLQPTGDNIILVPSNAINLRFPRYAKRQYTVRNGKLYDRVNLTHTITQTIKVELTWLLEFEDLPEVARRYITQRAGREYQGRYLGSESVHRFTEQSELQALVELIDAEGEQRDASILDHPDIHTGVLGNRQVLGGYGLV